MLVSLDPRSESLTVTAFFNDECYIIFYYFFLLYKIYTTLTMTISVTTSPGEQAPTRSSINSQSTDRGILPIS